MLKLLLSCKIILLLVTLLFTKISVAQDGDVGSWNILNANIPLNKKWNILLDPHLYSDKFYNKFYFYELKGTVGYKLSKKVSVAAGTGKYVTYTRGGNFHLPVNTNETRLFEQLFFGHHVRKLKFEHRLQLEQRFLKSHYRNRLRYRANLTLPLNKPASDPNSLFLVAFDELFLTDVSPHIAGIGSTQHWDTE